MARNPNKLKVVLADGHSRAGTLYNEKGQACGTFSQDAGETVEMPYQEAKTYLERGWATPVESE